MRASVQVRNQFWCDLQADKILSTSWELVDCAHLGTCF